MNPHLYGQLICDKVGKMYNEKKVASLINCVGKTGQLNAK